MLEARLQHALMMLLNSFSLPKPRLQTLFSLPGAITIFFLHSPNYPIVDLSKFRLFRATWFCPSLVPGSLLIVLSIALFSPVSVLTLTPPLSELPTLALCSFQRFQSQCVVSFFPSLPSSAARFINTILYQFSFLPITHGEKNFLKNQ